MHVLLRIFVSRALAAYGFDAVDDGVELVLDFRHVRGALQAVAQGIQLVEDVGAVSHCHLVNAADDAVKAANDAAKAIETLKK